jgi:menaquinone-dependent protoporphyrinogen oxidase
MTRILVAYATKHGTTREVAEAVARVATDSGAVVRLAPAAAVGEHVDGWDLVVLGAPIYSGRWHRDAHRFLRRHRADLRSVPVAVFGMGPRRDNEEAWRRSRDQFARALARRPRLAPVAVGLFGGVDPPRRNRTDRRDLRDWTTIVDWTLAVLARASVAMSGTGGAS